MIPCTLRHRGWRHAPVSQNPPQLNPYVMSNTMVEALIDADITLAALFEYWGTSIENLESVLGQSPFLGGIKTSRQWLWERITDTHLSSVKLTACMKALIPGDTRDDISFVVMVGWDEGWKIIEMLDFQSTQMRTLRNQIETIPERT